MKRDLYRWLEPQRLRPTNKFILQKLCDYANDYSFEAAVRIADLAQHVSCCERTVQTGLRYLEAGGYIVDTGRTKLLRSGGTPRIYRIAPDLCPGGADPAPSRSGNLHPKGRNCAHPYKETGKNLSKERGSSERPRSPIPAMIRQQFVDYLGETFGTGFLDKCEWDSATRAFTPHSLRAYERIRFEGWRALRDLKITVVKPSV